MEEYTISILTVIEDNSNYNNIDKLYESILANLQLEINTLININWHICSDIDSNIKNDELMSVLTHIKETEGLNIKYSRTKNIGKVKVLNSLIPKLDSDFTLMLNPDTSLDFNAFKTITENCFLLDGVYGFAFLRQDTGKNIIDSDFKEENCSMKFLDLIISKDNLGFIEVPVLLSTVLLQDVSYDIDENERFMPLEYIFLKLDKKDSMFCLNKTLITVEESYLQKIDDIMLDYEMIEYYENEEINNNPYSFLNFYELLFSFKMHTLDKEKREQIVKRYMKEYIYLSYITDSKINYDNIGNKQNRKFLKNKSFIYNIEYKFKKFEKLNEENRKNRNIKENKYNKLNKVNMINNSALKYNEKKQEKNEDIYNYYYDSDEQLDIQYDKDEIEKDLEYEYSGKDLQNKYMNEFYEKDYKDEIEKEKDEEYKKYKEKIKSVQKKMEFYHNTEGKIEDRPIEEIIDLKNLYSNKRNANNLSNFKKLNKHNFYNSENFNNEFLENVKEVDTIRIESITNKYTNFKDFKENINETKNIEDIKNSIENNKQVESQNKNKKQNADTINLEFILDTAPVTTKFREEMEKTLDLNVKDKNNEKEEIEKQNQIVKEDNQDNSCGNIDTEDFPEDYTEEELDKRIARLEKELNSGEKLKEKNTFNTLGSQEKTYYKKDKEKLLAEIYDQKKKNEEIKLKYVKKDLKKQIEQEKESIEKIKLGIDDSVEKIDIKLDRKMRLNNMVKSIEIRDDLEEKKRKYLNKFKTEKENKKNNNINEREEITEDNNININVNKNEKEDSLNWNLNNEDNYLFSQRYQKEDNVDFLEEVGRRDSEKMREKLEEVGVDLSPDLEESVDNLIAKYYGNLRNK